MVAEITQRHGHAVTVSITLSLDGPMLEAEEAIQAALNEAGMLLEQENLKRFDTDGSPIQVGPLRLTSKGQWPQVYETPYGPVSVQRHVYQTPHGGTEEGARSGEQGAPCSSLGAPCLLPRAPCSVLFASATAGRSPIGT